LRAVHCFISVSEVEDFERSIGVFLSLSGSVDDFMRVTDERFLVLLCTLQGSRALLFHGRLFNGKGGRPLRSLSRDNISLSFCDHFLRRWKMGP